MFLCQLVELFQRQNVELGFAGGNGVVAAWAVVEEGEAAEKVTTAEGGDMPAAARTERRKNFDRAAPDQVDRIARLAA